MCDDRTLPNDKNPPPRRAEPTHAVPSPGTPCHPRTRRGTQRFMQPFPQPLRVPVTPLRVRRLRAYMARQGDRKV